MKKKTLITALIVVLLASSILVMPTVSADEMFFVDFYVVDSQGNPLNGVLIEVTGIYNYNEIVYTESDGYTPRLALFSDQRNAHYTWTATYQNDTETGDFYVPDNYNAINIEMLEVNAPTSTPNTTPTPTPTSAITPTPAASTTPLQTPTPEPKSQEDPKMLLIAVGATIILAAVALLSLMLKRNRIGKEILDQ